MRRLITSVIVSLDGRTEGPAGAGDLDWTAPFADDLVAYSVELLSAATGGIVLGRTTYEGFRTYWPFQEGELADLMNLPPKLVFSRSSALPDPSWGEYDNARLAGEDQVDELKRGARGDLVVLGSGRLAASLLARGAVDEVQSLVLPTALGAGRSHLSGIAGPVRFEFAGTRRYPGGAVLLTHRPVTGPPPG